MDESSKKNDLGAVRIAYYGQQKDERKLRVGESFEKLPEDFFSLGMDFDYYEKLNALGATVRDRILSSLNDLAIDLESPR